jgi:hypothetical protein
VKALDGAVEALTPRVPTFLATLSEHYRKRYQKAHERDGGVETELRWPDRFANLARLFRVTS